MVLVTGATGLLGMKVCQRVVDRGEKVRALIRATSASDKVAALRGSGVEITIGDLKDPESLARACDGVEAVISTASSTLSRQAGDSIESVDLSGQLNLVSAAKSKNIRRFIFVSFRDSPGLSYPLSDAKRTVERAISEMNFTIIQASWFMEVWLSPALGFDYANARVRIYGRGTAPVSWVSVQDVAEMCAVALRHPAAECRIIEFGGPEALSPLEVVEHFERITGRTFTREHISEAALRAQFDGATDSMQKSFAGLMLGNVSGDAINMDAVIETFKIRQTPLEEFARAVTATSGS